MGKNTARTIIVGDVHGCADELDALLKTLAYQPGERLAFVGDLVAKGPDSLGVLERVRELEAQSVRGNHEEHCLRWWRAQKKNEPEPELKKTHREVAEQLKERDWKWLDAMPLWLDFPELNVWVIHAGLVPGVPLDKQDPQDLINIRAIDKEGKGTKHYNEGIPWPKLWKGPQTIVFGHDAVRGLQRHPFAIGLDSGCVYGGKLSAVVLPEAKIVSVPARKRYREMS